jgi:hypothetical protein
MEKMTKIINNLKENVEMIKETMFPIKGCAIGIDGKVVANCKPIDNPYIDREIFLKSVKPLIGDLIRSLECK